MDAYIDELISGAEAPPPRAAATEAGPGAAGEDGELLLAERGRDFSFDGACFSAKVVDVYDGDTVRVIFRHMGELVQFRARMAGYDSPEMKPPKAAPNRAAEVAAARSAKVALEGQVLGRLVQLRCGPFDKYGRLLATVYVGGESVNEWMVANGHGVPYDGGKKTPFAVVG